MLGSSGTAAPTLNGLPAAPATGGLRGELAARLTRGDQAHPNYVSDVVAAVLQAAGEARASDIHFTPGETELTILWRIDGVLQPVATVPRKLAANRSEEHTSELQSPRTIARPLSRHTTWGTY